MNPPLPDPAPILRLITGYWGSMALFAAHELGVFTTLAEGPKSAGDFAIKLGVPERGMALLLQAMAGLGVLAVDGERFANTPLSEAFLVEGRPAYLGNAIRYGADNYRLWGTLADVVRAGMPPADAEGYLGDDADRTRHFVWGMHGRALAVARAVVEFIELPRDTVLLDLGGGPGTYSILLAQKIPGLKAIVFDLPSIVAIAGEIIASSGVAGRVTVQGGDFNVDAYPSGIGATLLSGILHREPEAACRSIIGRARDALVPGGTLVISDVMVNADRVSPPFATLFGLHMLVSSQRGGVHSKADHRQWLEDAGLTDVRVREVPAPAMHTVITAIKR